MSSEQRKNMDLTIKDIVTPVLKEQGFKGSFPHFRRKNEDNIDLITFQFNRWGGSFVVELAICPLEGITMDWGEGIKPNKVTAHHVNQRFRLGAMSEEEDGIWFNFEEAKTKQDFEEVATNVLNLLNTSDPKWISNLFKEPIG
ncbi:MULTISPECIES: DUF4304 domain-containing protein [unclassified Mesobacillus]|uniref:DUF4304 domain-containing protein n=1 Tax=unclassified Mesobacillus TaxID=2675270 RepID=UPI002040E2D8|nr:MULTISPECIES: DUF4304 domain-containing protein [unclassified Mesobacillus]MCM3126056.1 DUF4304 domain-containing protein [Mesobacillus sp. MER 33]MCM3236031.1 DUF4304 domain-containing protein [Mesobacillus sp. MER 48]